MTDNNHTGDNKEVVSNEVFLAARPKNLGGHVRYKYKITRLVIGLFSVLAVLIGCAMLFSGWLANRSNELSKEYLCNQSDLSPVRYPVEKSLENKKLTQTITIHSVTYDIPTTYSAPKYCQKGILLDITVDNKTPKTMVDSFFPYDILLHLRGEAGSIKHETMSFNKYLADNSIVRLGPTVHEGETLRGVIVFRVDYRYDNKGTELYIGDHGFDEKNRIILP